MKKILLALAICFYATLLSAQFVYKIKADSVKITNDSCNAELILENSTKNIKGFLYNYGNGRTRFQKGVVKFNDSLYISGDDTINIGSVINRLVAANGLTKIGDSIKLGGSFLAGTTLNMNGFGLRFNVGNGESGPTTSGRLSVFVNRTQLSDFNDFYINTRYTGSSNFGGGDGSIFVENFWNPTTTINSGGYANFFSQHKSNISGLNMAGVKLYGFRSRFRVTNTNQTFGDWYHFYAGTSPDLTLGSLNNYYGLYVESLKIPNTINAYAIYSAGADDSVYNAGPVRWTKYKNNGSEDSVLTTDASGNLKLKLIASSAWSLLGNSATNPSTNFLGTTDNVSLRIRTNNTERAVIDSNGKMGIATSSPVYKLDINGDARISTLPFAANRDTVLTYDPVTKQVKATNIYSRVMLGSDVTNNNGTANTLQDVTGLSFSVSSGVTYKFKFYIVYTAAATTTGSRWSINGPSTTFLHYTSDYSLSTTSITTNQGISAYNSPSGSNNSSAATTSNIAIIEGVIKPSANGTVVARFASEVASSAIVAKGGMSYVEYEIIN